VPRGFLTTSDAVVTGRSFELAGGRDFTPPFHSDCRRAGLNARRGDALIGMSDRARRLGAQRVRVRVGEESYFGVLTFCEIPSNVEGPVSRSYELRVPEDRIAAASGGRISVAWELWRRGTTTGYAWILWLSDRPF
jgi:hypothetical protein